MKHNNSENKQRTKQNIFLPGIQLEMDSSTKEASNQLAERVMMSLVFVHLTSFAPLSSLLLLVSLRPASS